MSKKITAEEAQQLQEFHHNFVGPTMFEFSTFVDEVFDKINAVVTNSFHNKLTAIHIRMPDKFQENDIKKFILLFENTYHYKISEVDCIIRHYMISWK